jgi:uncharacterized protein
MGTINIVSILKRIVSHPLFLLILGFFLIAFAMSLPQGIGEILSPMRGRSAGVDLLISIIAAALTVATYLGFNRYIERRPNTDLTLKGAAREWGYGVFLGFAAMVATIGVIALLGGYRITGHNGPEVLTGIAAMAIVSGVTEEILLRGIVFRLVEQWLGSVAALMFSAALFGALHLGNPNASWLAAFAIALEAGVMLGAIYMLTRRLWAAIGLHMAWNATQGGVFGVKVSGTDVQGILTSQSSGSDLLSGGAFGAEASIPAMVICTALGLWILWRAWQNDRFVNASWSRFKTGRDDMGNT